MPNAETRQRLIAEATRVFITMGYGAATLDSIARAAGISKKTIYKYAASKADLFVAIVADAMRPIPVGDLLAADRDADPEATLRDFLRAVAGLALSAEGLGFYRMIVREAASFPEMLPAFRAVLADFTDGLVGWMDRQRRRGWLAIDQPAEAAGALLALLLAGTRTDYLLGTGGVPDAAARAALVEAALHRFLDGARAGAPDAGTALG